MTIDEAADLLVHCFRSGCKVFACGNGGSASQAGHFVGELVGAFRDRARPPLPAIDLTASAPVLTAIMNDFGAEWVFARQIAALGDQGDCLVAISTSGNSPNVVKAAQVADETGMDVLALTVGGGGKLALETEHILAAPYATSTPDAQEWHLNVLHALADMVESAMFGGVSK